MSELRITANPRDPYARVVEGFLANDFPANTSDPAATLDAVTGAIIASGQVRFGPAPNPESQVAIRKVISGAIGNGLPIPILVPWGSKKPSNECGIDVAEVTALKMLNCLNERVRRHYEPGIAVRLRVEDIGGFHLFADEDGARAACEAYVRDFSMLVRILGVRSFLTVVLESELTTEDEFFACADRHADSFMAYLTETDNADPSSYTSFASWKTLAREGWSGTIPGEMREFFRSRYRKAQPGLSAEGETRKFSRYLGGALARLQLNATGAMPEWKGDFIKINFNPPTPGVPKDLVQREVPYRTVLAKHAMTHLPPWRARGYLKVNGVAISKLATWYESIQLVPGEALFSRGNQSVTVRADYLVAS